MTDGQEKKGNGILENLPAFDGGGRRRLTSGAILVIGLLFSYPEALGKLNEIIAVKEYSATLILVLTGLLIYSAGAVVELVGEVFVARAIANFVWSYRWAWRSWRSQPSPRPIPKAAGEFLWSVICFATGRAIWYFILGLFGKTRWRMPLESHLSATARQFFDALPKSVRYAVIRPLGNKGEFGRKALIDKSESIEGRRWARSLTDQPKEVLALVSAVVLSILIYVFSSLGEIDRGILANLRQERGEFDSLTAQMRAFGESADRMKLEAYAEQKENYFPVFSTYMTHFILLEMDFYSLRDLIDVNKINKSGKLPNANDVATIRQRMGSNALGARKCVDEAINVKPPADAPADVARTFATMIDLINSMCVKLALDTTTLESTLSEAHETAEISRSRRVGELALAVSAILMLYVAFFNRLTSSTASLIEKLSVEATRAPSTTEPSP